jgi:hypothetical protein
MKPSRTVRIEITVDSTGRFIKVVKVIIICYLMFHIEPAFAALTIYFFMALTMSPALMAFACSAIFCS